MAASLRGWGTPEEIASRLADELTGSAITCDLVARVDRKIGGESVILLIFEKYYMRSKNRAALSVLLTGSEGELYVDAVGAGGGGGAFSSFSWGVEEDFEESACDILEEMGFVRL